MMKRLYVLGMSPMSARSSYPLDAGRADCVLMRHFQRMKILTLDIINMLEAVPVGRTLFPRQVFFGAAGTEYGVSGRTNSPKTFS